MQARFLDRCAVDQNAYSVPIFGRISIGRNIIRHKGDVFTGRFRYQNSVQHWRSHRWAKGSFVVDTVCAFPS